LKQGVGLSLHGKKSKQTALGSEEMNQMVVWARENVLDSEKVKCEGAEEGSLAS
jgi:hypothetical protein